MVALIFKCCWVFGANFSWDIHHIFLQPSLIFHQVFSENIGFLLNYWIFCEDKISRTQQPYCKIGILYLNLNHATKGCDSNLFGGNFPFVTFEICPGYFVLVGKVQCRRVVLRAARSHTRDLIICPQVSRGFFYFILFFHTSSCPFFSFLTQAANIKMFPWP